MARTRQGSAAAAADPASGQIADWVAVRAAFLAGATTAQVRARFGLSPALLTALLVAHGYTDRRDLRHREFTRLRARLVDPTTGRVDPDRLTAADRDTIAGFLLGDRGATVGFATLVAAIGAWQDGANVQQMSQIVGRDVTAPWFRRRFLEPFGVDVRWAGNRAFPPNRRPEVVAAYLAGETTVSLAETYGVDESTVRRLLHRSGVVLRPRGTPRGTPGSGTRPRARGR